MNIKELQIADFLWIDVVDPSRDDLDQLSKRFNLHDTSIRDCMAPEHLPKFERFDDLGFAIFRAFDAEADKRSDTVQGLTHKLAVFVSPQLILTVRRHEQPYIQNYVHQIEAASGAGHPKRPHSMVVDLILAVVKTYEPAVNTAFDNFEELETQLFSSGGTGHLKLKASYHLKRRVAIMKRMLRLMVEPVTSFASFSPAAIRTQCQHIREVIEELIFQLDEIQDNLNALLSLQISLASQKTNEASHRANEIMRLLTIFSVIFLPLNLLAGIYGMNFQHMPELTWPWGYPLVIFGMVLVAVSIYIGFKKRGWLKKDLATGKRNSSNRG